MNANTDSHSRTITESIVVTGTCFRIIMNRDEEKHDCYGSCANARKVDISWYINSFAIYLRITQNAYADTEEYIYIKAGQPAVKTTRDGLSGILSVDEKRAMLRAIDELNVWQNMHQHLPELGDYVWRIAFSAKLIEVAAA